MRPNQSFEPTRNGWSLQAPTSFWVFAAQPSLAAQLRCSASKAMRLLRCLLALLVAAYTCMLSAQASAASSNSGSAEQKVIVSLAPFASRDGRVLSLKLNNKRTLKLRDSDTCDIPEKCLIHRLLGQSPDRQFFAVEVLGYESRTVIWIGRDSGTRYEVYGEPDASPNGKWIVTANPSEFGGTNGVFIWKVHAGRLIEKLNFQPDSYALYSFLRWESNDTIALRKVTHADKSVCPSAQFMEFNVTVRNDGTFWKFDENAGLKEVRCQ